MAYGVLDVVLDADFENAIRLLVSRLLSMRDLALPNDKAELLPSCLNEKCLLKKDINITFFFQEKESNSYFSFF